MNSPLSTSYRESRWAVAIGFLLPTLLLLVPDLVMGRFFAFRDAGFYYYPLYEWIGNRWQLDGAVPLWNFQENGGLPLVSDPTSALWYPGKWIFAAPLPYPVCFQLFLSGHLVLAWWGVFSTCRFWNRSHIAASIAASSYAFGGYVLFQVSNPPYLIGAAWLPWAAVSGELALRRGNRRALIASGACLSLMMLGGDPQTAYHTLIVLALYLLWRASWSSWLRLCTIALTMIVLSSIVILPSTTWVDRTDRVVNSPRSVWDLMRIGDSVEWQHLVADPQPDSHEERTYNYSYPPSRWSEYIWPNISGDLFPKNQRWIKQSVAHQRTWVPSLYMGLLPVIAALSAWALRGLDRRRRWMSRLLVLSLLAACGKYGLVAIWELVDGKTWLAGGVGGPYHTMVALLPGYGFFRYPAKWLVFSTFSMACLSAWGVDSFLDHEEGRAPRHRHWSPPTLTLVVLLISAALLAVHLLGGTASWFETEAIQTDRLYGPFDGEGAWWGVTRALSSTVLLGSAFLSIHIWLLPRRGNSEPELPASRWIRLRFGWILLLMTTLDLAVANHGLLPTVAGSARRSELSNLSKIPLSKIPEIPERVWRVDRSRFREPESGESVHQERWEEANERLFPKLHLNHYPPVEMIRVQGSATANDWQKLAAASTSSSNYLHQIGVQRKLTITNGPTIRPSWSGTRDAEPRFWIAEHVSDLDDAAGNLSPKSWRRIAARKRGELYLGRGVAVEDTSLEDKELVKAASVTCVTYRPNEVGFAVLLETPQWLVVNDRFHNGWQAKFRSKDKPWTSVPIHEANGWARAVYLPAGEHRVKMVFWPNEVRWGMQISGVAWLVAIIYVIGHFWASRRSHLSRSGARYRQE